MVLKIILLALWVIVSLLEGRRDAFTYHHRMNSSKPDNRNIHWIFATERSVVLGLICGINLVFSSVLNTGVLALSFMLVFSFLHNGMYYKTRNVLDKDIYKKRWWENSATSTASVELSAVARTFMAFVGLVGIVSTFTLK